MATNQKNQPIFNILLSFMTVGFFAAPAANAQMRHDRDGRGSGDHQDHSRPNTNDGRGGRPDRGSGRPDTNEGREHGRPPEGRPDNNRPDRNWPGRDHDQPHNDRPDHGGPRPGPGAGNGGGWPRPDRPGNDNHGWPDHGRPGNHRPDRDHNHGRPDVGHHAPPYVPPYVPPYNPPYQPPYVPPPSYEPPVYQPPAYEPEPPIYEPAPIEDVASAQVDFTGITRRSGGEWLRVSLATPMSLDFFQVYVQTAAVQIHEAYLLTRSGLRIPISDLAETGTFTAGDERTTSDLSEVDGVIAIDLRVEAMGALANVTVTVSSAEGTPVIRGSRP